MGSFPFIASRSNILYCVLNWGLGHATRSAGYIKGLLAEGHSVSIASDGIALELLRKEFPGLVFYELAPYKASYAISPLAGTLLKIPFFAAAAIREQMQVGAICRKAAINAIISDNRYGAYSSRLPSILVCHQLDPFFFMRNGLLKQCAAKLYAAAAGKFTGIVVPDSCSGLSISGAMSENKYIRVPVRRFLPAPRLQPLFAASADIVLCVLSGPEPARSRFESYVLAELEPWKHCLVVVRGSSSGRGGTGAEFINIAPAHKLAELYSRAALVVARSGYSTLLDMQALPLRAILVPTPGMPEQQYLAQRHSGARGIICIEQKKGLLRNAASKVLGAHYGEKNIPGKCCTCRDI
jgi:hypothetical protein